MNKFNEDFMLGASTAAHQVEGNNTNSDYWVMENMEYTQFVEPVVTLMYFTSPVWLIKMGGWDNEQVVELFAKYAEYVTEQLGSELKYICTINEANMRLSAGKYEL